LATVDIDRIDPRLASNGRASILTLVKFWSDVAVTRSRVDQGSGSRRSHLIISVALSEITLVRFVRRSGRHWERYGRGCDSDDRRLSVDVGAVAIAISSRSRIRLRASHYAEHVNSACPQTVQCSVHRSAPGGEPARIILFSAQLDL
jgi:hypothetical protein